MPCEKHDWKFVKTISRISDVVRAELDRKHEEEKRLKEEYAKKSWWYKFSHNPPGYRSYLSAPPFIPFQHGRKYACLNDGCEAVKEIW